MHYRPIWITAHNARRLFFNQAPSRIGRCMSFRAK
jgi:hypothetical protein